MANKRDVRLIIKAVDEATPRLEAVNRALKGMAQIQEDAASGARRLSDATRALDAVLKELDHAARSGGLRGLADSLRKAQQAFARVKADLRDSRSEVARLADATTKAALAEDKLVAAAEKAAQAVRRETQALKQAQSQRAALAAQAKEREAALRAQEAAQKKIERSLATQNTALARAEARWNKYTEQLLRADRPTKRLLDGQRKAAQAVRKHSEQIGALLQKEARYAQGLKATRAAAAQASDALAKMTEKVARQEQVLAEAVRRERELSQAAKEAAGGYAKLAAELDRARRAVRENERALAEAKQQMRALSEANREVSSSYAQAAQQARQALEAIIQNQHRTLLESKRDWKAAENAVRGYAAEAARAGFADQTLIQNLRRARLAAQQAKNQYIGLRNSLQQMRGVVRTAGNDTSSLRAALASLTNIERRAAQGTEALNTALRREHDAFNRAASTARRYAANVTHVGTAQRRAAAATNQSASAAHRVAGAFNRMAQSMRRTGNTSRTSLSLLQRIRGQLLAIAASYAGIFAMFRGANQMIEVQRQWDAAVRSIGVAINSLDASKIGREMEYVKGVSDRLGVSIQSSVKEFSRLAVATRGTKISFEDTKTIFEAVSGASRVMNLSAEQTDRVFTAIVQIASKGKIQMEELRQQLGDNLPGAIRIMAKAAGYGADEMGAFYKAIQKGEVSSEMLVEFAKELNKEFGPQLQQAVRSNAAEFQRMKNAWFELVLAFNKGGALDALTRLFRKLNEVMRSADFKAFVAKLSWAVGKGIDLLTAFVAHWKTAGAVIGVIAGVKMVAIIGRLAASLLGLRTAFRVFRAIGPAIGMLTRFGGAIARFAPLMSRTIPLLSLVARGLMALGPYGWAAAAAITGLYVAYKWWTRGAKEAGDASAGASKKLKVAMAEQAKAMEEARQAAQRAAQAKARLTEATERLAEAQRRANSAGVDGRRAMAELEQAIQAQKQAAEEAAQAGAQSEQAAQRAAAAAEGVKTASQGVHDVVQQAKDGVQALRDATQDPIEPTVRVDDAGLAQLNQARTSIQALNENAISAQKVLAEMFGAVAGPATAAMQALGDFTINARAALEALQGLEQAKAGSAVSDTAKAASAAAQAFAAAIPPMQSYTEHSQQLGAVSAAQTAPLGKFAAAVGSVQGPIASLAKALPSVYSGLAKVQRALGTVASVARRAGTAFSTLSKAAQAFLASIKTLAEQDSGIAAVTELLKQLTAALIAAEQALGQFQTALDDASRAVSSSLRSWDDLASRLEAVAKHAVQVQKATGETDRALNALQRIVPGAVRALNDLARSYERAAAAAKSLAAAKGAASAGAQLSDGVLVGTGHTGGLVGGGRIGGNSARHVSPEVFHGAPRYQTGGIVGLRPDEVPAILHAGEEVITPNDPRHRNNMPRAGLMQGGRYSGVSEFSAQVRESAQAFVGILGQAGKEFFWTVKKVTTDFRDEIMKAAKSLTAGVTALTAAAQSIQNAASSMSGCGCGGYGGGGYDPGSYSGGSSYSGTYGTPTHGRGYRESWSRGSGKGGSFTAVTIPEWMKFGYSGKERAQLFRDQMRREEEIRRAKWDAASFGNARYLNAYMFRAGSFHEGGIVGLDQPPAQVRPFPANAMRFHNGGMPGLQPNEVPAILQKGEEVLTRNDPRHTLNGGAEGGAVGRPRVQLKIINTIDPGDVVAEGLGTAAGEEAVLNALHANSGSVRKILEV